MTDIVSAQFSGTLYTAETITPPEALLKTRRMGTHCCSSTPTFDEYCVK
jgi:hypothetical protein